MLRVALFIGFVALLFTSCQFEDVLPSAAGKPGELVVVADTAFLNGSAGQELTSVLKAAYPSLPQYEPWFSLVTVPYEKFKNILARHHAVLIIDSGKVSGDKLFALTMKRDVWAAPQLVFNLRISGSAVADSAVITFARSIRDKFNDFERERLMRSLKSAPQAAVCEVLHSNLGIDVPLDNEFFQAKSAPGYMWVRKETMHTSIGLQFKKFEYTSDSVFNGAYLVNYRDSLCRANIPGPTAGSYMTTDRRVPVVFETETDSLMYVASVSGLWKTEGDFMGGPFKSYLLVNKQHSTAFFIDAYVYAPKFDKREYIRQVDAIARSVRF